MTSLDWTVSLSLAAISAALAASILLVIRGRIAGATGSLAERAFVPIAYLFENGRLIDATEPARRLVAAGPRRLRTLDRLTAVLDPHFPELHNRLQGIAQGGTEVLRDSATGATVTAGRSGTTLRITVEGLPSVAALPGIEPSSFDMMDRELDQLQETLDAAPVLIWREDEEGAVRWANRAYLSVAAQTSAEDALPGWPLPPLFAGHGLADADPGSTHRLQLDQPGQAGPRVFDTVVQRSGVQVTYFAMPADRLDRAERSLHDFVQTLSRTFADLPTGLAIFDRDRRLALFNPALTELTALEPIYLATRPRLADFLDALRNHQRMPEPKNYVSWRDRIATLEQAAEEGSYHEDWALPTGQTFRVTGQPHPNGSIAFLFEDISAEMSLTRSFREELELGQAVIDAVREAIAVFSADGTLILTNSAYRALWGNDPASEIRDVPATAALDHWFRECVAGPEWARLRPALLGEMRNGPLVCDLQLISGRKLSCRVTPLSGNRTMVAFTSDRAAPAGRLRSDWTEGATQGPTAAISKIGV